MFIIHFLHNTKFRKEMIESRQSEMFEFQLISIEELFQLLYKFDFLNLAKITLNYKETSWLILFSY